MTEEGQDEEYQKQQHDGGRKEKGKRGREKWMKKKMKISTRLTPNVDDQKTKTKTLH
eukprot:m.268297 g.268297  ORF g.268297 m.268297 type:complete len:57 (-) comp77863_c0_seq1:132-302(-)